MHFDLKTALSAPQPGSDISDVMKEGGERCADSYRGLRHSLIPGVRMEGT